MNKKEIEKWIKIEKKKLGDLLKIFEMFESEFSENDKEELINSTLDRLNEL